MWYFQFRKEKSIFNNRSKKDYNFLHSRLKAKITPVDTETLESQAKQPKTVVEMFLLSLIVFSKFVIMEYQGYRQTFYHYLICMQQHEYCYWRC